MNRFSRLYFGQYAGWAYLAGNLVMTAKGAIEAALKDHVGYAHYFMADPMASVIGILFIIGSSMLGRAGGSTRGFRHSQYVALVAFILLVVHLALEGMAMMAVMGTLLGTAGCAWSIYKTLAQEKEHHTPSFKIPSKIAREFPYLPAGILDVASHILMGCGAFMSVQPDPVLGVVAFLWGIGAAFIALAAPRISSNQADAVPA